MVELRVLLLQARRHQSQNNYVDYEEEEED
jgi:hypothetical protein